MPSLQKINNSEQLTKLVNTIKLITYPVLLGLVISFSNKMLGYAEQTAIEVKSIRIAITEMKKDVEFLKEGDVDKEIRLRQLEISSYKKLSLNPTD